MISPSRFSARNVEKLGVARLAAAPTLHGLLNFVLKIYD